MEHIIELTTIVSFVLVLAINLVASINNPKTKGDKK